ncbi:MAG TPA: histidine kinase dimerization/phospho-acceptor domain-containing protein [Verrucomicrobiae bacterium]|jgi:signal transduction histidine kinase|nr:histidine kinase dimerization/phospho-acceptor domain-containing protein [Verrucomicrobiae bacterium]
MNVRFDPRQTLLVVSNDALLCAAARRALESRRLDVQVAAVSSVETALQIIEEAAPGVVLLAEESGLQGGGPPMQLDSAVHALAAYAPVVVMGRAERETSLQALIAAGIADYVPRSEGCMSDALDLLEHRLARRQQISESIPAKAAEDRSKDFAEILRHELNNPLTGILGNAELLLAEIARKKDGKLPYGGLERVETIAALAMRMRETVRQLSHEWETRNDPVRQA